ncbi:MAG: outer membrane lipoprotein carrier protein LolA, partial [Proteobacteria bacterium]|nr:outer membrane lipoprotein carrier protein LolA [Pseudomonadota bacterium]
MNRKGVFTIVVSILFLGFAFSQDVAVAGTASLDKIVTRIQDNYKSMKDYEATFVQETKIKAYPRAQRSSGQVFYKKPGGMRWNYEKPEKSEIVTDGQTVWMYTPSLNQVMKMEFSTSNQSRVATAFLSGMGNLKEDFDLSLDTAESDEADHILILRPKDKMDSVKTLVFTVD